MALKCAAQRIELERSPCLLSIDIRVCIDSQVQTEIIMATPVTIAKMAEGVSCPVMIAQAKLGAAQIIPCEVQKSSDFFQVRDK